MLKAISGLGMAMIIMFASGCAGVNKAAEKVGETGGKAMKVPTSVSEGAAKGMKGEEESNPYDR